MARNRKHIEDKFYTKTEIVEKLLNNNNYFFYISHYCFSV